MRINPVNLSWTAPTQNTDGTPIELDISYRLNVDGSPFLDFPGSLNPDGTFSQPVADIGFSPGTYTLTLQAFYVDEPALISDPSNTLVIAVGVARPNPPLALSAA